MEHKTYARMLELKDELVGYRRYLHQYPELSFDLPQTRAFVLEKLKEFGYEPQTVGRAGITCTCGPRRWENAAAARRYGRAAHG